MSTERLLASARAATRRRIARLGLLGFARYVRDALWSLRFARSNARYWLAGASGLPIPSFTLRILVAASPDIGWFLQSGRLAAVCTTTSLERNGAELAGAAPVLDFGCGCGRVTRHWAGRGVEIHGSDLNPKLVAWCRRHLPFATFTTNPLEPPLAYANGTFGLVYANSVFTHLPEALQRAWMREMQRVLRPGGHLLLTTHGERYLNELTDDERRRFRLGELILHRDDQPGSNVCGAYHPEAYVRGRLAEGFAVVDFVPEGALGNPWQDLWLLRRM